MAKILPTKSKADKRTDKKNMLFDKLPNENKKHHLPKRSGRAVSIWWCGCRRIPITVTFDNNITECGHWISPSINMSKGRKYIYVVLVVPLPALLSCLLHSSAVVPSLLARPNRPLKYINNGSMLNASPAAHQHNIICSWEFMWVNRINDRYTSNDRSFRTAHLIHRITRFTSSHSHNASIT